MNVDVIQLWPQVVALIGVIAMIVTLREKVRSLEEKVKELFKLFNSKCNGDS
jgi:hypothetical protein